MWLGSRFCRVLSSVWPPLRSRDIVITGNRFLQAACPFAFVKVGRLNNISSRFSRGWPEIHFGRSFIRAETPSCLDNRLKSSSTNSFDRCSFFNFAQRFLGNSLQQGPHHGQHSSIGSIISFESFLTRALN